MQGDRTGGPAFPMAVDCSAGSRTEYQIGMTLRDYFAAHCPHSFKFTMGDIAKYLELPSPNEQSLTHDQIQLGREKLDAMRRYKWADAMLSERAKEKK